VIYLKTDIDYLNYNDLNLIENKIDTLTDWIRDTYIEDMPVYNKKTWVLNELPYIQEIDRIEHGIKSIGYNFYEPDGWITTKEWITSDNLYPIKSFDYRDYNRWLTNLNLIENAGEPLITIWNGISQLDWNTVSDDEWIEGSTYKTVDLLYNNEEILYNNEKVRIKEEI
jgi:hypothetical protein